MYVLCGPLAAPDHDALGEACRRARLHAEVPRDDGPVILRDDLLAVFHAGGERQAVDPVEVRDRGAYPVLIQDTPSVTSTLGAIRAGYSFVLPSPLGVDRVASFLGYLARVAAPRPARVLRLDGAGILSTPSTSVPLDPAEAAVLRLLAGQPDRIVGREDIAAAAPGGDPLDLVARLRERFDEVGSGAQILKVPHMGFRLVGTVREVGGRAQE